MDVHLVISLIALNVAIVSLVTTFLNGRLMEEESKRAAERTKRREEEQKELMKRWMGA